MDIVSRLRKFMDSQSITNSQFADTCGIPRPTLSQILAGRNKKISDELISKIHTGYPWLNVMWLLFGEGNMESDQNTQISEPQNEPESAPLSPEISVVHDFEEQAPYGRSFIDFGSENSDGRRGGDFAGYRAASSSADMAVSPGAAHNAVTGVHYRDVLADNPAQSSYSGARPNPAISDKPAVADTKASEDRSADIIRSAADAIDNNTSGNGADPDRRESSAQPRAHVSLSTAATKRISNIVVFYDDNSFESFIPSAFVE